MGWIVLGVIVGAVMILLSKRDRPREPAAGGTAAVPPIGGPEGGPDGGPDGGDGGEGDGGT
ncbi:hypothetical protein [Azospirillum sp.]|uniref:hypothetical protein n=1 Tax=Azospirillum sp. TaxID=34012 RepID=UPI003D719EAC